MPYGTIESGAGAAGPIGAVVSVMIGLSNRPSEQSTASLLKQNLPPGVYDDIRASMRQNFRDWQTDNPGLEKKRAIPEMHRAFRHEILSRGFSTSGLPLPGRGPRVPVGETSGTDSFPVGFGDSEKEPVFGLPMILGATIPAGIFDIFKGTSGAKAIAGAKTVLSKIPGVLKSSVGKAGSVGGMVGGAISAQVLQGAIDDQFKRENAADAARLKKEQAAQDAAIRKINADRRAKGLPIYASKTSSDKAAERMALAKFKAGQKAAQNALDRAAKKAAADQKKAESAAKKAAKATAAKIAKQIKAAENAAKATQKLRNKRAAQAHARTLQLARLASGILVGVFAKRAKSGKSSVPGSTTNFFLPPSFDRGQNFSSLRAQDSLAAGSKTIVASGTKVAKCRSDSPKRKKGVCRSGFFKETPSRTTYKVWSERKCL